VATFLQIFLLISLLLVGASPRYKLAANF